VIIVKDYYKIMGISRDADLDMIRRAYPKAIWKVHPGVSKAPDKDRVMEIQEAYEVLSDPERRKFYNDNLAGAEKPGEMGYRLTAIGHKRSPEPLFPEPISIMKDFFNYSDPIESFFERFYRNFTGVGVSKAERPEGLTVELILTPDESLRGGRIAFKIPVLYTCPFCDGTGREWQFPCSHCYGEGMVENQESVFLDIPPTIRSGTIYEIPLRGFGIRNFYLRVFVRVGDRD
jgi:DnaJ-class molecular chaperone